MAPVPPGSHAERNHVGGTPDSYSYDSATNTTEIDLGRDMPDTFDDEDQFEQGRYVVGGNTYTVISYTDSFGDDELLVQGDPLSDGITIEMNYLLYDDDDQTLFDSPCYCSLGSHETSFRDAYIEPEYLSTDSYSDEVNFNLNLTNLEQDLGVDYDNEQDVWSSKEFWACLVVSCYQPTYNSDQDPDGWGLSPLPEQDPGIEMGAAYRVDADNASMIFLEIVTNEIPCYWTEGQVVAHEMGHTGGLDDHESGHCHMNLDINDPNHFCDDCIVELRTYEKWLTTN